MFGEHCFKILPLSYKLSNTCLKLRFDILSKVTYSKLRNSIQVLKFK